MQRAAEIEGRFRRIGIAFHRPTERPGGILRSSGGELCIAQVVVRIGKIGIELQRLVIGRDRFLGKAGIPQCARQIEVQLRVVGPDLDGMAKTGEPLVDLADLEERPAEVAESFVLKAGDASSARR